MSQEQLSAQGRIALEKLRPQLAEIAPARRAALNLAADEAAAVVRRVGDELASDPALRKAFVDLGSVHFDIAHVDRLRDLGAALFHTASLAALAAATRTKARLPVDLVASAVELRKRMVRVLDYNLGQLPHVVALLEAVRSGRGHLDLGSDLVVLGGAYENHAEALALDKRHYDREDAQRAFDTAQSIQDELDRGLDTDQRQALLDLANVWTLTWESYNEVRDAALWMFRSDPDKQALFPSLYASKPSGTKKPTPETAPPAEA